MSETPFKTKIGRRAQGPVVAMAIIGYARVSRHQGTPTPQEAKMRAPGAEKVLTERGESSHIASRSRWEA